MADFSGSICRPFCSAVRVEEVERIATGRLIRQRAEAVPSEIPVFATWLGNSMSSGWMERFRPVGNPEVGFLRPELLRKTPNLKK
jgi:hypothetical protein